MIKSLTLENFLSYRKRQTLPMSNLGLVLVKGDNRISKSADSNGAGKSAIFSALCWALYGETLNGLKGEQVCNRFAGKDEPTRVSLDLEDEGGPWELERGLRPKLLGVGMPRKGEDPQKREAQDIILDRIGMGFRTFRNAVVFGQGAFERFAHADQGDQLKMLDEIQGLDLKRALDRAKKWRDEANERFTVLTQEASSLAGEGDTLGSNKAQLVIARTAFEGQKKTRVSQAETRVADIRKDVKQFEKDVAEATKASSELSRLRRAIEARTSIEGKKRGAEQQIAGVEARIETVEEAIAGYQESITSMAGVKECPTCYQKITPKVFAKAVGLLIDGEKKELASLRKELKKHEEVIVNSEQALKLAGTDPVEEYGHKQALAGNLPGLRGALTATQAKLRAAEQELSAEMDAAWDGVKALEAIDKDIVRVQARHDEVKRLIKRAVVTLNVAEYWVEAFGDKGVRSLLVDSVAGFINERLTYHLESLAGGEVVTRLSAVSAWKSGASRERMSVASSWAWGGAEKGAGSHGQDRRVDLALFASLQDLAESRAARPFPVRIWDEPGDALDARGQELFLGWVTREARARGTGFLVTHNPYLADAVVADHVWTVVLTREGSIVEMS